MRLKEKQLAIELRKQGKTYTEICSLISNLPRGTLSKWLSKLSLTEKEEKLLQQQRLIRKVTGRASANHTNRMKKQKRLQFIYSKAENLFSNFKNNPFFIAGIILYWAEGAKTTERVQFMNSDPRLVILMIRWFEKFLKVKKEKMRIRLFSHKIYFSENHELFWEKIIPLPKSCFLKTIYKPTPHTLKKNPNYRGCIRVDAGGVNEFHMIHFFQQAFTKKYHLAPVV